MSQWAKAVSKKKTNNHSAATGAKIELRRKIMTCFGENARVFDAFAGSGMMYRHVWKSAAHYVGCDLRWYMDDRTAYAADNRRVLRCLDLAQFNVFDFDAYGSPWEQCCILARRRRVERGELIGVLLTDGSGLNMKMGGMPLALKEICGFEGKISGASGQQGEIINMAISGLAEKMRCEVLERWQAKGKTGAGVIYTALVLQGIGS